MLVSCVSNWLRNIGCWWQGGDWILKIGESWNIHETLLWAWWSSHYDNMSSIEPQMTTRIVGLTNRNRNKFSSWLPELLTFPNWIKTLWIVVFLINTSWGSNICSRFPSDSFGPDDPFVRCFFFPVTLLIINIQSENILGGSLILLPSKGSLPGEAPLDLSTGCKCPSPASSTDGWKMERNVIVCRATVTNSPHMIRSRKLNTCHIRLNCWCQVHLHL